MKIERPAANEVDEYYLGMIEDAPDGDLLQNLADQIGAYRKVLGGLSEERAGERYEPGKWSLKELVGHVVDTEIIMTARALAFGRGETQPLPGFDQDDYVETSEFDARTMASLLDSFEATRRASIAVFENLPAAALARGGKADGRRLSARGIGWLLCGHAAHHLAVASSRYLS